MGKKLKNRIANAETGPAVKRDYWFNEYHDIPELGITGTRKVNDRIAHYNQDDFKNATAIDLGCNMGQMSFQAEKWGATVMGVEFDANAIANALEIKEKIGSNVNFVVDDLDSNFFWNSIPKKDVVMFLAVIDTVELDNRYGILSKACAKTNKVMYFEGHGKAPASKYIKNIVDYTDFSQIIYKGDTPVNRPFFRCTRDELTIDECIQQILNSKYNKIAVVGKSLAGKTTIREKLHLVNNGKYSIIDDLKEFTDPEQDIGSAIQLQVDDLEKYEKFVFFDYRALEYYNEFDVVFFVTPNEDLIGQTRERKNPMRSPSIKDLTTIKEIYTVRSY
tara:strand:- start:2261 stop:3259 length:999 start_codon:yes stop_codon:yes gene_type:complete